MDYVCECGRIFDDLQKLNGHKANCPLHLKTIGKSYSIDERLDKQRKTIIEKYGSIDKYNEYRTEKIKESFKNRTDTFQYIIKTINKSDFIHDYIDENKPRSFMKDKYNIPSDYMMDMIVKEYDCKKSKKQSVNLGWKTKYQTYPKDNMNNWKKGHKTREQNSGSVELSYKEALIKQKRTMVEKYGTECALNFKGISTFRKKKMTKPNIRFSKLLDMNDIEYEQEFVIESKSYDFKVGNTLIEINPTPTHNSYYLPYPPHKGLSPLYHSIKSKLAEENGYRCIHVWDWDDLRKIILLLRNSEKLYARKCQIKEITKQEATDFCNEIHLQGYAKSSVHIGLFYDNKLVSVMTFGKPRYNKNYEWELVRYCSSYSIVGGSKKLFKFFIKNYKPSSIISYCDLSKFSGKTYYSLGFVKDNISIGRHWYNIKTKKHVTDNLLRQRGFDQLFGDIYGTYGKGTSNEELMYKHGFLDVYDCGQARFVWSSN